MKKVLKEVSDRVNIDEGQRAVEQLLLEVYFEPGISTKILSRKLLLPLPLVAAIKKEFIKAGILEQKQGVRFTGKGKGLMDKTYGFAEMDMALYNKIMEDRIDIDQDFKKEMKILKGIYKARPEVDSTIDQSKGTMDTSLKRAVLCLQNYGILGNKILCVGDDDLVSVAIGFLLKKLFPQSRRYPAEVHIVDIDRRFLKYIKQIAKLENLPITGHYADLREPLSQELHNQFDCFFTDPPYTLQGMNLFISRGLEALKEEPGLPIFFSFAHRSPDMSLAMQREYVRMGLTISRLIPNFNRYEGAEIIGNTSQMTVLMTTNKTQTIIDDKFEDALYTGEIRRTLRTYQCKECGDKIKVGYKGDFRTIEKLKNKGCPDCRGQKFELIEKKRVK